MTPSAAATVSVLPRPVGEASVPYRVLPHNIEAEQGLLGTLLVDNRGLEKVGDFLRADHFFVPAHQRIFDAIRKINERGQAASPVTLKTYFEQDADLAGVGGADYLAELAANVVSLANTADYGRTIYDLHLRRELIVLGEDMAADANAPGIDREANDCIEQAEAKLYKLAETGQVRGGFVSLKSSVATALEIAEKAFRADTHVTGVTTGLRDLDQKLGGLHPSDLLILAARPSMGKTALAVNIAFRAAEKHLETGGKQGAVVGFFSLEMSSDQLATRILSEKAGISGDLIRKGQVKEADFQKFIQASHRLTQVPLFIDDTPALSISAIRTRARRLKRQHNLGLLVVDYLQLLTGTGSRQSTENRVLEISEITRDLKAIAKEFSIPVLALSQLSRAVEQREDKRPMLSDLRESGSIEQDADVVMFIFREEYYLSREEPSQKVGEGDEKFYDRHTKWAQKLEEVSNTAETIVAKQRHGPIGTVKLFFDPNVTRFADLDKTYGESS